MGTPGDGLNVAVTTVPRLFLVQSTLLFEDQFEDHLGLTREEFLSSFMGDFATESVRLFQSLGYEVCFVFLSRRSLRTERAIHQPTGAHVVFVPATRVYLLLSRSPFLFRAGLGRYIRQALSTINLSLFRYFQANPGVVYVQDYNSGRYDVLSLLCRRQCRALIGTHHGGSVPGFLWPIKRVTLRFAALLTVLNTDEKRRVSQAYPGLATTMIANPIATERFRRLRQAGACEVSADKYRLFYAGRLERRKNVAYLIEAMQDLPEAYELTIAGSGPQQQQLRSMAQRLGLSRRVHFLGRLDAEALAACYLEADLFVLASHYEGWAVVLGEALACGLAVLARDVEGVRDQVIHDVTGRLVPASAVPQEFAAGVERMLDDIRSGPLFSKERLMDIAEETCSQEIICRKWRTALTDAGLLEATAK